jgi:hypothetical protein
MRLEKLCALLAAEIMTAAIYSLAFGNIALALRIQDHFFNPSGTSGTGIFSSAPEEEGVEQKDKKVGQNKKK